MQEVNKKKYEEDRYQVTGYYNQQIESLWPYGMSFDIGPSSINLNNIQVQHWKQINFPKGTMKLEPRPEAEINIIPSKIAIKEDLDQELEIDILNQIDPYLMIEGRISKLQRGYSLQDIKEFARRLGISSAGKKKKDLIKEIIRRGQDRGLPWREFNE